VLSYSGRRELRQAKVEDFDESIVRDHQVLGLQVPVRDARLMRLGQPSATCAAISIAFRIGSEPAASSSRSVFPSTNSIAM
jgi:hypothetical protein